VAIVAYMTIHGSQTKFFGESSAHGKIPVLSVSLGGTFSGGGPHVPGQQAPDVHITKKVDASSPLFFRALLSAETLDSVLLEFVNPGSDVSSAIELADVIISSYRPSNSAADPDNLTEDVSFNYKTISYDGAKNIVPHHGAIGHLKRRP
jgi:type VI secretion system Hcp family effector